MRAVNFYSIGIVAACVGTALLLPEAVHAYVGPGAGVSVLGALWGLIVGVALAIGVILFWPLRLVLRKLKGKNAAAAQNAAGQSTSSDGTPSPPPPAD